MSPLPPALSPLRSLHRKGDLAENAFIAKTLRMGFTVARPVNSHSRYDFLVEAVGKCSRVQVKSVWRGPGRDKFYLVSVHGTPYRYKPNEVDLFAVYVVQEEAWYIIPRTAVGGRFTVHLSPHRPKARGKFERFREAWCLLLPRGVKIGDLKAQADPAGEASYQGTPSGVP